jgi:hypothetical protein
MEALSAIGLCTLSLVWMGVVLFIATDEAHRRSTFLMQVAHPRYGVTVNDSAPARHSPHHPTRSQNLFPADLGGEPSLKVGCLFRLELIRSLSSLGMFTE